MQVTVEIPDEYVGALVPEGKTAERVLLEEAVAAAYRAGRLTTAHQVKELLGLGTRMQAISFLGEHEIEIYTVKEFEEDMATFERMFPRTKEKSVA